MQRLHLALYRVIIPMALLAVSGCVNLKPRENTTRFYVLGASEAQEQNTSTAAPTGLSIGLKRLRLAAYLDTPYIVMRQAANEVTFSEQHRWGEDLRRAINRIVAGHLASHSDIQRVDVVPWPIGAHYDYVVQIQVLHFEGVTDAIQSAEGAMIVEEPKVRIHMVAKWQVLEPNSTRILHQGTTDVTLGSWTLNIYANMVAGLDQALETLAQDLAAALNELE